MLGIQKGPEPRELKVYREKVPDATYKDFRDTKPVRDQLYADQGGLCAYCMRKVQYDPSIPKEKQVGVPDFTIEHWSAQSTSERDLHWPDMLGVCSGRLQVGPSTEQICDKARGNIEISIHPVRDAAKVEDWCAYRGDGTITIKGHQHAVDTLQLNASNLKNARHAIVSLIRKRAEGKDLTFLNAELSRWEGRTTAGTRLEYAGVALYLLRKFIRARTEKAARLRKKPAS